MLACMVLQRGAYKLISIEIYSIYEHLCPLTLLSVHSLIVVANDHFGIQNLLLNCYKKLFFQRNKKTSVTI